MDDVRTTCPYCGVGCGVVASTGVDGSISVQGDPDHPANFGRLCSKGAALADVLVPDGRLLYPHRNGARVSSDEALDDVAKRFKAVIEEDGPDAVAFYVSGQLLTEDYYVANKLMKGFIGSANIDTNSRLCMASSVAGHKRAFGEDVVPGTYEDLELADLWVLTGSNLAWCHPVLYQRILAAKAKRPEMKIVVIDPRQTATTELADLHLALAPGSDVALFQGLLNWLNTKGIMDTAYVAAHTQGMPEALASASLFSLPKVAEATQLERAQLASFYDLFAKTGKVVTVYSQGVNQAADGTDRVGTIINCHLFTGRIGKPGMGPFSITGQPNAMGGREVGGLANQLACHMDFGNPEHEQTVQDFWNAPRLAKQNGLKAVDLFDAVADGKVKAIWIMATNPVDSLPRADKVAEALKACPTVVVSDVTADTDTAKLADILLPAAAWGEKDGTVTNSERRISRQRQLRPLPGEVRADWDIIADVGRRMGWQDAFDYRSGAQVFREYAAMTAFRNEGARHLDLGGLASVSDADYDALAPVQWPVPATGEQGGRLFAKGGYTTPKRRANFIVPAPTTQPALGTQYPYVLNTGRIRDQWHTMTRTGLSARLSQHMAEPFVEIHPEDALKEGIGHASLVRVISAHGDILVRALITKRQRRGSIFVPMHWTDEFAAKARVDTLVHPLTDPFSGQPASKNTAVSLAPYGADWHGFLITRERPQALLGDYWALAPCAGGYRLECAGLGNLDEAADALQASVGAAGQGLSYTAPGQRRFAFYEDGRLLAAGFFSKHLVSVSRQWAVSCLSEDMAGDDARLRVLASRPGADRPDQGAIICSCMDVGINAIRAAALNGAGPDVDAIGEATGAGTNCGSCRAEIGHIINTLESKDDAAATAH